MRYRVASLVAYRLAMFYSYLVKIHITVPCPCVCTSATIYSGLALDVQRHLLYFTNEGQGQVAELELKLKLNLTADANSRIIDSTNHSRPRCVAVDSFNRFIIIS